MYSTEWREFAIESAKVDDASVLVVSDDAKVWSSESKRLGSAALKEDIQEQQNDACPEPFPSRSSKPLQEASSKKLHAIMK